jgi:ribonucleoside-diphosphate reductase alpha chain
MTYHLRFKDMVKEKAVFSHEEAIKASNDYFGGDELAATVFVTKYALHDSRGLLELTPRDMHRRLAREFARVEAKYPSPMSEDEIFSLLDGFKYIVPQGSPMSAIGNEEQIQSISNCFVIPSPLDAYGSIARADENVAQIQKRRGGVGLDVSNIRPRTVSVKNAAGTSDGVGIFMERYSNTTREVAQSGRRGALMITIDGRHPDVEMFVNIKQDKTKVTGANVSVRITDDFMKAVENGDDYALRWPVSDEVAAARFTKTIVARDLWQQMMKAAWSSAEPGVLYWDTIKRLSMADEFADKGYETICTNPCAELPLSAADSCRLLLLNLISYVKDPYTATACFDYDLFSDHVVKAQRLMDDLVDLELEAIERILTKIEHDPEPISEKNRELALWRHVREACSNGRRTGTGITALGDALAALGQTYGSEQSIVTTEAIYQSLAVHAHTSSVIMAKQRGAFPAWEPGRYKSNLFAKRLHGACSYGVNQDFEQYGRRNIALTTTAPAGSVSTLTQTTSGIEPAYLLHYKRRKKLRESEIVEGARVDHVDALGDKWQEYDVYHHGLKKWMDVNPGKTIEESPYHKATSADVDWIASVDLLAAAQKWTEHSISKTINLPREATVELVSDVYMRAWKLGIKGVTVYRDGCRDGVLIAADTKPKKDETPKALLTDRHAPKRPKDLKCDIHRATVKGEKYIVLVGMLEGRPYEVFAGTNDRVEVPKKLKSGNLVKAGKDKDGLATYNLAIPVGDDDELVFKDVSKLFDNTLHSTFTRMISLSLRHGVPTQFVCEQMSKSQDEDMQSFAKVVSRVLKSYIVDGTKPASEKTCTNCGSIALYYSEGCVTCSSCGSSKCG